MELTLPTFLVYDVTSVVLFSVDFVDAGCQRPFKAHFQRNQSREISRWLCEVYRGRDPVT